MRYGKRDHPRPDLGALAERESTVAAISEKTHKLTVSVEKEPK
jgi:hypothetical protein